MKNQQQSCNCTIETDRMINEGLGNGTIVPRYDEAHRELKEKEVLLKQKYEEQQDDKK